MANNTITITLDERGPISYERIEQFAKACGTTPNNWVQDAIKHFECWLEQTNQVTPEQIGAPRE